MLDNKEAIKKTLAVLEQEVDALKKLLDGEAKSEKGPRYSEVFDSIHEGAANHCTAWHEKVGEHLFLYHDNQGAVIGWSLFNLTKLWDLKTEYLLTTRG